MHFWGIRGLTFLGAKTMQYIDQHVLKPFFFLILSNQDKKLMKLKILPCLQDIFLNCTI